MWEYIFGLGITALVGRLTYYYYKNRYNDDIIELLNITHNDIKCIKYYYRGNKYIFLTENLEDDITRLEKEIDSTNQDKDKKPEIEYKYIKIKIFIENNKCDKNCDKNCDKQCDKNCDKQCDKNCDKQCDKDCDKQCDKQCDNVVVEIKEIQIEEPKLLYSLIGPANSFYFAFDVDYYKKLTKFMNFLFETEEGTLIYGRFSMLLSPQKYFDIKSKLIEFKKNNNVKKIEWELE